MAYGCKFSSLSTGRKVEIAGANKPSSWRLFPMLIFDLVFTSPSSNPLIISFWKNIDDYPPPFQKAFNGNISINCQYYRNGLLDEWLIFTKTPIIGIYVFFNVNKCWLTLIEIKTSDWCLVIILDQEKGQGGMKKGQGGMKKGQGGRSALKSQ